jgi:hypothetical protein
VLNLIYKKLQNQKAKLIKSGLGSEKFGRPSNYAIESKKIARFHLSERLLDRVRLAEP